MVNACRSRNVSSPAIASTSPPVRTTPAIGEERRPWRGCRQGAASICWRRSGDALNRNHRSPSALTAIDACVRGLACGSPATGAPAAGGVRIPLRKAAAGSGAENADLHGSDPRGSLRHGMREATSFRSRTGARVDPGIRHCRHPRGFPRHATILHTFVRHCSKTYRPTHVRSMRLLPRTGRRTRDAMPIGATAEVWRFVHRSGMIVTPA